MSEWVNPRYAGVIEEYRKLLHPADDEPKRGFVLVAPREQPDED